jgi:hypothetical protein
MRLSGICVCSQVLEAFQTLPEMRCVRCRSETAGKSHSAATLSGNEWIQASMRNDKVAEDFVPGATLNDFNVQLVKRIKKDLEISGNLKIEHYKAPV